MSFSRLIAFSIEINIFHQRMIHIASNECIVSPIKFKMIYNFRFDNFLMNEIQKYENR